jgi:hypothetical protein
VHRDQRGIFLAGETVDLVRRKTEQHLDFGRKSHLLEDFLLFLQNRFRQPAQLAVQSADVADVHRMSQNDLFGSRLAQTFQVAQGFGRHVAEAGADDDSGKHSLSPRSWCQDAFSYCRFKGLLLRNIT